MGINIGSDTASLYVGSDAVSKVYLGSDEVWTPEETYLDIVLANSPIGYWPLTETSGTNAADLSGNGRNGTYTGGYILADTQLANSLANTVKLDGDEDYINIADVDAWSPTGASAQLTVEAWIKPSAVNRSATMIVAKHQEWQLRLESDGKILWDVNRDGTATVMGCTSASAVNAGTVYHIMAVYNRATPKVELFINGSSVSSSTVVSFAVSNTTNPVQIGRRSDGGGSEFIGIIGYVAIYPTALSSSDAAAHYAAGIA